MDKSRAVLRITLRGLREIGLKELTTALARSEEIYLKELLETEDVEEGVQAFVEKRKPQVAAPVARGGRPSRGSP